MNTPFASYLQRCRFCLLGIVCVVSSCSADGTNANASGAEAGAGNAVADASPPPEGMTSADPSADAGLAARPDAALDAALVSDAGDAGDASEVESPFDLEAHLLETAEGAASEQAPYGVPEYWSWVSGAGTPSLNPPAPQYTHANYWGAVFRGLQNVTPENTKVEIRNCSFWLLYDGDSEWTQVATSAALGGGTFTPMYVAGGPEPEPLDFFPDGADVVPAPEHIWHFWPENSYQPVSGYDLVEVLVNCQSRLGLRDAQAGDDRDSAEYIIHVGADWRDPNDPSCANNDHICEGFGVSRFERVLPSWRNHTFHSLTEDDLAAGGPQAPAQIFELP